MKTRMLIGLSVTALVLVGFAWFVHRKHEFRAHPSRVGQPVFPRLDMNAAARIRIVSGTTTTELTRASAGWQVASRFGYPADFDAIRELARELRELKVGQIVQATDEQRQELELDPQSPAPQVMVYDEQGRVLAQLQAGKMFTAAAKRDWSWGGPPQGRYVRIGDREIALVSSTLDILGRSPSDWLLPRFVRAPSYEIMALDVTGPGRTPLHLRRPSRGASLQPDQVPDGREADPPAIERLAGALDSARMEDVADPSLPPSETGLDDPVIWQAQLESGRTVTVRLGRARPEDGGRYAAISVAYEAPTGLLAQAQADVTSTNDTVRQQAENQLKKIESDRRESEELQDLVGRWTYVLSKDAAESMLLTLEEITRPIAAAEAPSSETENASAETETDEETATPHEAEEHPHG